MYSKFLKLPKTQLILFRFAEIKPSTFRSRYQFIRNTFIIKTPYLELI